MQAAAAPQTAISLTLGNGESNREQMKKNSFTLLFAVLSPHAKIFLRVSHPAMNYLYISAATTDNKPLFVVSLCTSACTYV